jgi:hypothetical protein
MNNSRYKLVREHDNLTHYVDMVSWIEWDAKGKGKEKHTEPALGRSLILHNYHSITYIWLTTPLIEILEEKENVFKFKTENSIYTLTTLK